MSDALAKARANIARWRADPRLFARECVHVTPDGWQDDVLEAYGTHNRIAMKACKGPGKTFVEALIGWHFLLCYPHPKVVATSISGDNLRDGLWAEFAKLQQRSPILQTAFEWGAERIRAKDHPETWWASARQWSKSADPGAQANTMAGVHADYVLFILDESGGIPDGVAATAEAGMATGRRTVLVQAGNPTHLSGPLYRACTRDRHLYRVFEISGDPEDPKRASRVSLQWAKEQLAQYGREHPYYLVNVLGQFPPQQANALLGVDQVDAACRRTVARAAYLSEARILGVDVARFGDDRSVILRRQGPCCDAPKKYRGLDLMTLAGQVALEITEYRPDAVFVDETGLGSGVVDRLRQLGHAVTGVNFGGKPLRPEPRTLNRRAEMWFSMAEWVKRSGCLPDDAELRGELVAPSFRFDGAGRLVLESKEELKARGLASPDCADALALTFAEPVVGRHQSSGLSAGHALTEYDPFRAAIASEERGRHITVHEYDPYGAAQ